MTTPPPESGSQALSPRSAGVDPVDRSDAELAVAAAGLERLRGHRVRRRDASGIDGLVATIRRDANRNRTGVGSFVEAWEEEVPEALRSGSSIRSIRGGVARIDVPDAATKYELEQVLRGGLLARLRLRFGQPLRRIRIEAGHSR